ncbi:jeltraxin-like [Engraulis encrasicolus]|uniref:jeltraxin-like n=1 Tax=Engraulis encrasicolus TaxID=184585 RepID=UPI002FD1CAAC
MKSTVVFCIVLLRCTITFQEKGKMEGKMFSFPEEHSTSFVKLKPLVSKNLTSASVCLRFYTDQVDGQVSAFFSLSAPGQPSAFTILRHMPSRTYPQQYELHVGNKPVFFNGLEYTLNKWNSLCATWDGSSGMAQVNINGKRSVRKMTKAGLSIGERPSIVLGRHQDGYAEGFVGHMTDVHIWDYVIPSSEIDNYGGGGFVAYKAGNYLNWSKVEYTVNGTVLVEGKM